jgi:hypothetical protein
LPFAACRRVDDQLFEVRIFAGVANRQVFGNRNDADKDARLIR